MDERTEPSDPNLATPDPVIEAGRRSNTLSAQPQQRSAPTSQAVDAEFSAFYRGSIAKLVAFVLWLGARLPEATDIAQETMILAYRYWPTIDHPKSWTQRVASRMLARRLASLNENLVDQIPEGGTALLPLPTEAAAWEQQREILRVLQSLPPRQRQVMAWTFDGYSPSEIADELKMTSEAVRASLMKGRRTLAAYLGGKGSDEP
jgi:RNA polymerase sigma factor (sigma-70 family)